MAEDLQGPVTVHGKFIAGDGTFQVDGVNTIMANVVVQGSFQCVDIVNPGFTTVGISTIRAIAPNNIVTLTGGQGGPGGFVTTGGMIVGADFGVNGNGFFDHDVDVGGNVNVKGDIQLVNGDCAEDFTMASALSIEAGTVVVIGPDGSLSPSQTPYDKRVVGVISGARDYKPAIVLDRKPSSENRQPVALVGKTFCNVDASYGAIEIGDLLTTSGTPGYAMKAGDPVRAFGSVIGKALQPLAKGCGQILMLIALQ